MEAVNKQENKKLPLKMKMGYLVGSMGTQMMLIMYMYYQLFFYTDVLGISAGAASTIVLIARVWDFINDPIMGIIVDKTHKKGGGCRFFIKIMTVPLGIFFVLSFAAPNLSNGMKVVWAAVTYIGQGMCNTALQTPRNTLTVKCTKDNNHQRVNLQQFSSVGSHIGSMIVPAITMPLIGIISGENIKQGFLVMTAVYALIMIVFNLFLYKASEGLEDEDYEVEKAPKVKAMDCIKALLSNKLCLIIALCQLVYLILSSLFGTALTFYFTYNIGNVNLMSVVTTISSLVGIIPVFVMHIVTDKLGNFKTAMLGILCAIFGLSIRFVFHDASLPVIIIGNALYSLGTGFFSSVTFLCVMESIDYGVWKTGKKGPLAIYVTAYTFAAKAGLAFGGVVAGYILMAIKYVPNAATQTASVLAWLFRLTVTIPLISFIIIAIIFIGVIKVANKLPQIREELKSRELAD